MVSMTTTKAHRCQKPGPGAQAWFIPTTHWMSPGDHKCNGKSALIYSGGGRTLSHMGAEVRALATAVYLLTLTHGSLDPTLQPHTQHP